MSFSMDVSRDTVGPLPGSPRILSGSRTAASRNTGTSYKTKRPKLNRRAAFRCLAITSLPEVIQQPLLETALADGSGNRKWLKNLQCRVLPAQPAGTFPWRYWLAAWRPRLRTRSQLQDADPFASSA